MITSESLKQILPQLPEDKRNAYLPHLQNAMAEFEVTTPRREAAFLAQLAHESAGLTRFVENLNYGAKGLMATWPKRYPTLALAQQHERQPEKIANYVYTPPRRTDLGNGNEASGDGWRYRGRGPIQLTGRANYQKYGRLLGLDLVGNPDSVAFPEVGFRVAASYWKENGLNELADRDMFETITRRINGALKGLEDRRKYYERAKTVLGVTAARGVLSSEPERGVEPLRVFTRGAEFEAQAPSTKKRKSATGTTKRLAKVASTKKARTSTAKRRTTKAADGKARAGGAKRPTKKPVAKKLAKKTAPTGTAKRATTKATTAKARAGAAKPGAKKPVAKKLTKKTAHSKAQPRARAQSSPKTAKRRT